MPPWRTGGAAASRPVITGAALTEVKAPAPRPPAAAPTHAPADPGAAEAPADPAGPDPVSHPLVREAIEVFKARVVDIQPKRD